MKLFVVYLGSIFEGLDSSFFSTIVPFSKTDPRFSWESGKRFGSLERMEMKGTPRWLPSSHSQFRLGLESLFGFGCHFSDKY